MPRGVYEHYNPQFYVAAILKEYGLDDYTAYNAAHKYLDNNQADLMLDDIAEMQKQDNFIGTSETFVEDFNSYMSDAGLDFYIYSYELGQIMQDLMEIGASKVSFRFSQGYYDKSTAEQEEFINVTEKEYYSWEM